MAITSNEIPTYIFVKQSYKHLIIILKNIFSGYFTKNEASLSKSSQDRTKDVS